MHGLFLFLNWCALIKSPGNENVNICIELKCLKALLPDYAEKIDTKQENIPQKLYNDYVIFIE